MSEAVSIDDIRTANSRLEGVVRRTPLIENDALNAMVGHRVFVKLECLQHTGSFKWRGAWNALKKLSETTPGAQVLAYSSGNHAQGVARAAKLLNMQATIVMPKDAPPVKIQNTRDYGADVVLYDRANGESREEIGGALATQRDLTLIKPYDHIDVIAGQGTCGLEIAEQLKQLGVNKASVLVCCGGGGLTAGIALALESQLQGSCVMPVEPESADDVCRSLVSGKREGINGVPSTVCDAIITPSPGELTFPIMKRLCGPGITVTDAHTIAAVQFAFHELRVVAEPGGAAALAAAMALNEESMIKPALIDEALVVVVTGGNVNADWFKSIV